MQKSNIEWCSHTWNPVTGCKNNCEYCYARKIANRFKDTFNNFEPTFYKERLEEPVLLKKPANIFVCSMADLFGDWVEDEWIKEIFENIYALKQHRYLFLTKNPSKYLKLKEKGLLPVIRNHNMWFGITMDKNNLQTYEVLKSMILYNKFLSVEPILEEIDPENFYYADWIIIGAETGNRKGKVVPKREWIERIVEKCKESHVPVFMKNSLQKVWGGPLIQEFPW